MPYRLVTLNFQMDAAKSKSLKKPLGIAFVTMVSLEAAKRIHEDHKYDFKRCSSNPRTSSVSVLLEPHLWTVKFAPPPQDIFWYTILRIIVKRRGVVLGILDR